MDASSSQNSPSFKEEKESSPSFKDEGLEGHVDVPPRIEGEDIHEMKESGADEDDKEEEDEEVEDEDEEMKVPPLHLDTNVSPLHNRLHQALHCDLLHPIHVEVKNLSYWYASRAKMGPKKHAAIVLRQNKNNFRWESYIFKMKPREEDLEIVPVRSLVGAYKSKMVAYKHGEKACRERDSNPALVENSHMKPGQITSTHFHLTVVSTAFDRLSVQERQELVYEALLQGAGTPLTASTPTASPYPKEMPHQDLDLREPLNKEGVQALKERNKYNYTRPSSLGGRENSAHLAACVPTRIWMGSVFGQQMCNLDVFRVLMVNQPLTLIMDLKTPSQWKPDEFTAPDSERYGRDHLSQLGGAHISKHIRPEKHRARVALLSKIVDPKHLPGGGSGPLAGSMASPTKPSSPKKGKSAEPLMLSESLGMDPEVSGIHFSKKKTGGIYGHFFRDLPVTIKDMLMQKYRENKHMIQAEGNMLKPKKKKKAKKVDGADEDFKPVTGMSKMLEKAEKMKGWADPDVGVDTEQQMTEELYISARKVERAVMRLQRMRRAAILHRAVRVIWKRKFAAINIQRQIRGRYARMYVTILQRLVPVAVVRIQRFVKMRKTRRIVTKFQALTYRLTRWALPKIKRFLRNCFLQNIAKFFNKASVIQSACRLFLVKRRIVRVKAKNRMLGLQSKWRPFFHEQVVKVQRRLRGNWGRARFLTFIEAALVKRVDLPAAIKIQKIYRGLLAKRILAIKRYRWQCMLRLQRVCKAFVHKIWRIEMARIKRREDAAVQIQRIARGRFDRKLIAFLQRDYWYVYKFLPAVLKTQTQVRAWCARKKVDRIKLEKKSAKICVNFWRGVLARRELTRRIKAAREKMIFDIVTVIQKCVRRFLCVIKYPALKLCRKGQVMYAAKVIMRAWKTFVYSKRMQLLLDDNRQNFYKNKLPRINEARAEIIEDRNEINGDIGNAKSTLTRTRARIKALENFCTEAQLRHITIEKELLGLSPEDYERGWSEAFTEEYDTLNRQMRHANEEMRLCKAKDIKLNRELTILYCELEDVELELEHVACMEMEAYEGMRRAEVGRIERRVNDAKNRNIRIERCKWKTEAIRLNVIRRNRPGWQSIMDQAKSGRTMTFANTISFEKRQMRRDFEDLKTKHLIDQDGRAGIDSHEGYETYARSVDDTYDSIITSNLSTLRYFTLEERASMLKKQYKSVKKKKRRANGGQFATLKSQEMQEYLMGKS